MTSSNGNIFRVTGHLCGVFTGPRWIPRTKASDAELWCIFDLRQNKWLSKQSWGWWFETLSCPLWRHCNDDICTVLIGDVAFKMNETSWNKLQNISWVRVVSYFFRQVYVHFKLRYKFMKQCEKSRSTVKWHVTINDWKVWPAIKQFYKSANCCVEWSQQGNHRCHVSQFVASITLTS